MNVAVITPAYGRDYQSAKDVLEDFNNDKDFILQNITDVYSGKPCNKSDLIKHSPYTHAQIRYNNLMDLVVEELPEAK